MIERKLAKTVTAPEHDMGAGGGGERGKSKPWEIPWEGLLLIPEVQLLQNHLQRVQGQRKVNGFSSQHHSNAHTHPEANWQGNMQILPESHSRFKARQRRAEGEPVWMGPQEVPTAKERQRVGTILHFTKRTSYEGWEWGSVVETSPSMREILGSVPCTA